MIDGLCNGLEKNTGNMKMGRKVYRKVADQLAVLWSTIVELCIIDGHTESCDEISFEGHFVKVLDSFYMMECIKSVLKTSYLVYSLSFTILLCPCIMSYFHTKVEIQSLFCYSGNPRICESVEGHHIDGWLWYLYISRAIEVRFQHRMGHELNAINSLLWYI